MPLTVCPLSNVKLCVFETMADHNLATLLDAGLCVTINSDDPAYFGGYINENFTQTFAALPQLTAVLAERRRRGVDARLLLRGDGAVPVRHIQAVVAAAAAAGIAEITFAALLS
jgi:adenosine deaminase